MKELRPIGEPLSAVEFFDPRALKETEPDALLGFESHRRVVMALAWQAAARRLLYSILLFGWPGTGKGVFPRWIAGELSRAGLDCFLITIQCCRLALSSAEEMRKQLSKVDAVIANRRFRPTIVSLEEIDALREAREEDPAQTYPYEWAFRLLSLESTAGGAVVFGVTNEPLRVDPALRAKLRHAMFLNVPNLDDAAALLKRNGIPEAKAKKVARGLFLRPDNLEVAYSGRGLISGAKYLTQLEEDLRFLKSSEISDRVMEASGAVQPEELCRYKEENWHWIARSHALLELAGRTWTRLFPGGEAKVLP
ncbi:MAG: ATP-binding protein [Dehalococcoidia bacterium]|nr:ATP-binding protein [Dehalococcoidia bacterium]